MPPAVDANVAEQLQQLLMAMNSVREGDFSVQLPPHWEGLNGKLADAFNDIVNQNKRLANDLARVAQRVGGEGRTRQRMPAANRQGQWAEMEQSVNGLIRDMARPIETMTEAMAAVAKGDLSRTVPMDNDGRPLQGEFLRAAGIVNRMLEQMSEFSSEVTRVALEVGTAGRLGGQAKVKGVSGVWKDLTDSVNQMASNLTAQVRNISEVTIAVANGDLSRKITVDVRGEILQLKEAINTMVDQLRGFASEVTRVAREVGTEGKLGGQAIVPGVAGTWKDLTDSVNAMASNLTSQVRNIAEVTTAVAKGDLSRKITVDVRGEILELKNTINTMVDQLNGFSSEVTRVAREVGSEGRLGGQAQVPDVAGTWKDLTDSVNSMASNLTSQVRNIAEVTTAVAKGDLSRKITVDVRGEILELKDTMNTMVDQLNGFAAEVTRVAREVGTEGKLGGQAQVPGVAGTWADLTDSVNAMASNLTSQVRNIAEVTTAVAKGDLSRKITVDVRGEILELKNTINVMVDQLNGFAAEVTRVAREVGTEGKLGGQAQVPGVAGTWKDLTDNVNSMASNLTAQVRNIAEVTTAVAKGDLSRKIAVDVRGEILQLKETINTMVDQLNGFAAEVTRVAREVGTEGKLGGQAQVPGVAGTWKDLTDNVNSMASNLTTQVRNIAEVATAVAKGDLSRKIAVDAQGEILQLKSTINVMVDQLNGFAAEVTRVAREVGTEGKLGGQAQVPGVAGTWKDLTDNVNSMGANLTTQVRGIAKVVTAVANGDLHQKLTVEAKGEIAELADTINSMTETLEIFADQVTTVAREVGVEGRLGGQANVPGTAGIWKDLTANVNQLAANLTTQVRAIAEVATSVTQGDLTRSIQVDVRGELADLKDNINAMIGTLRATTESNREQDWLKTNLAKFSGMMQGQRDMITLGHMLLSELAPLVYAQQGVLYVVEIDERRGRNRLRQLAGYADASADDEEPRYVEFGQGLIGQCAAQAEMIVINDVPAGTVQIESGLISAVPRSVVVLPVLFEDQVKAVIELASLTEFTPVAARVPRAAVGLDRHRAQHHRSDDAHRAPALAVAAARRRIAVAAEGTAADQRGHRAQGHVAGRAEDRGGTQEPGNRTGPPRAGRKGGRTGAHLALQVRVPREHVARAAHAAELDPDPRPAVGREPGREPQRPPGRIRQDHPRRGLGSVAPDLRHPRSVEDRIGHGHRRQRRDRVLAPARKPGARLPPRSRTPSPRFLRRLPDRNRPRVPFRSQAPAADPQEPAVQRAEVHRARQRAPRRARGHARLDRRASGARRRADGHRLRRHRHGHRHLLGEAAHRVRSVPAGRRGHVAQVRRHGPGPCDLARNRGPARRRTALAVRAGQGFDVHAVPAAGLRRHRRNDLEHAQPRAARRARRRESLLRTRVDVADDRDRLDPDETDPAWWWRTTRTTRRSCATSRARAASRCSPPTAAPKRCGWCASTRSMRSRSTSSCPTCSAGRCSRA